MCGVVLAVENLGALQGIVWKLKKRWRKSRDEIKCYFFEIKLKKLYTLRLDFVVYLAYFIDFRGF